MYEEINLKPLFMYSLFSILGIIIENYIQFEYELYFRSFCLFLLLSIFVFMLNIYVDPEVLSECTEYTPVKIFTIAIVLSLPIGFISHISTLDGSEYPMLYYSFLIIFFLIAILTIISIVGLKYFMDRGCRSCKLLENVR